MPYPFGLTDPIDAANKAKSTVQNTVQDYAAKQNAPLNPPNNGPTNPDNNLLVKGNSENYYDSTKDQYTTPGYTEDLVKQGIGGQLNDYYEFANNKLQDQFANMGGANSGALLRGTQELRANQAHDMENLAQAADAERFGRIGAGQGAASAADSGKVGRLGTVFNASLGLGTGEGNTTGGFYANASSASNPYTQEGINAKVQASTINPFENFIKDATSAAGAAGKFYGAQ